MSVKIVTKNKKALFNYHVEDRIEAGIVLVGSEVKSLRDGRANLVDSYAIFKHDEVYLLKAHISHYPPANQFNHNPTRERKLLLHREQIDRLQQKIKEQGYTLIPISIYFKKGKAKLELGLCRGKKKADKRESMKKRDSNRDIARAMRSRNR